MLYLEILGNFMSIFLIFAPSKINYARTLLNLELIPIDRKTAKNSDETVSGKHEQWFDGENLSRQCRWQREEVDVNPVVDEEFWQFKELSR